MRKSITKYIFTLIFACSNLFAFAQKKQNVYFLKNNDKIVLNKDSADYTRVIQEPDSGKANYILKEFYKNGSKKRFGTVSKFEPYLTLEGLVTSFYENGNREKIENFNKNKLVGKAYYFYENGKIKEEGDYQEKGCCLKKPFDSEHYKVLQFSDSTGKSLLDENGSGTINVSDATETLKGNFLNGLKDGEWTQYIVNEGITYIDVFENGKFIKGKSVDNKGKVNTYDKFQILPEFKGGILGYTAFLAKNLNYPDEAKRNMTQGRVSIEFFIEKDGSISHVKVVKSISDGCDQEALRVIKKSPKWIPGKERGQPVRVKYLVPIVFKLQD